MKINALEDDLRQKLTLDWKRQENKDVGSLSRKKTVCYRGVLFLAPPKFLTLFIPKKL